MACENVTMPAMPDPLAIRRAIPAGATFATWHAADGWQHRRFDWPNAAGRGRILVQSGRADIVEKYLEVIAHLHRHGWSVTAFDWRGQGGSGRLSADPRVGHADDFAVLAKDLADFWCEWAIEGDGPHVLLAHSMGAHLALRVMLDAAVVPDAAVLVAPMIGIRSPVGPRLGRWLTSLIARAGDPARPAWRVRPDQRSAGHRQRLLTHSAERHGDEAWWYERQPELLLGPPSWAWLREAFRSGAALQADPRLTALGVPIQMLVAEHDGLVDAAASLRLAVRLPDVEVVRFGVESAHEILREDDAVRLRAYAAIDRFLDERAP